MITTSYTCNCLLLPSTSVMPSNMDSISTSVQFHLFVENWCWHSLRANISPTFTLDIWSIYPPLVHMAFWSGESLALAAVHFGAAPKRYSCGFNCQAITFDFFILQTKFWVNNEQLFHGSKFGISIMHSLWCMYPRGGAVILRHVARFKQFRLLMVLDNTAYRVSLKQLI